MKVLVAVNPLKNLKAVNYVDALKAVGIEADARLRPETTAGYAGLVLPGGIDVDPASYGQEPDGARGFSPQLDALQSKLLEDFVRTQRPVLAICRGLQLLNVHFGGTLIQDLKTSVQHRLPDADAIHACGSIAGSEMERLFGSAYFVNSAHHQAVDRPGTGLRVTSLAQDGTVESLEHESLPILAVQWHPERILDGCGGETVEGIAIFEEFKRRLG